MNILRYWQYLFVVPVLACVLSGVALGVWGLKPGIDLEGGSLLQVSYADGRPSVEDVHTKVDALGFGEVRVQPTQEKDYLLRQKELTPAEKEKLMGALGSLGKVTEVQFNSVGPSIGAELLKKAWWAIGLISLCIIIFVAFAFRGVSKPVASWKYGVVVIVTLLHDIIIPTGLFALLGHTHGAEVDALFIVALLTILGISVNDTIVVFDRIRENLKFNMQKNQHEPFETIVNRSVMQTLARSINTSVTVIITLIALYVLGPAATKNFALTLIVGMVAGTYSSIFLASPLLVLIERYQKTDTKKRK